jgi:hypothetical protein
MGFYRKSIFQENVFATEDYIGCIHREAISYNPTLIQH